VAYAVTYLFGTAGVIWFLPTIGPKLMGVNLKEEAKKLQAKLAGGAEPEPGIQSAYRPWDLRAYRVTGGATTVADFEASFKGERVFVQRIRRTGTYIDVAPASPIRPGDEVAVMGRRQVLLAAAPIGVEIEDKALRDIPAQILDVVVTKKELAGQTLGELAKREMSRGVALATIIRGGQEMPVTTDFVLNRGDVLRIFGAQTDVERAAKAIGYAERPSSATDMIGVGIGIVVGGLIGLLSVSVAGLPLTLTASGGALVGGIVFGWLRSLYPVFGRIPEPAIWVFDTVGLAVFIGVVGLTAGPTFLAGVQKTGVSLVFVGAILAILPHFISVLFGRYVLRMNPLIVLGACAGAGTMTAALRAVQDEAGSKYPALGYTVPYAVGNFILTAWGPVIVMLMSLTG
jgi:putative transport protein